MTLLDGEIDQIYSIKSLEIEGNIGRRLQSLGLTYGTKVRVVNKKKNGAVIFQARGTRLAIGKDIASRINVVTKEERV